MPGTDSGVAEPGDDDIEDIPDFDQLAEQLIDDATSDDINGLDPDEELTLPPLTIRLPRQAIQSALQWETSPPAQSAPEVTFHLPRRSEHPLRNGAFLEGRYPEFGQRN